MKYIRYIAAILALGFLASRAEAALSPIVINLTAAQQSLYGAMTSTTNITATATNITSVMRYTSTNTVINNAKILKMLANSFNTNFPATAALKVSEQGEIVVAVGTNVILNAKAVLNIPIPEPAVVTGTATATLKKTPTVDSSVSQIVYKGSAVKSFTYDDSSLSTADGKTTNFKIEGLETLSVSLLISQINGVMNSHGTYVVTVTGAGEGTISDKDAVVKGAVTARVTVPGL